MLNNKRRYLYILFIAIGMHILIKYFGKVGNVGGNMFFDFFIYIFMTMVVWEGNRFIDKKLDDFKISLIPKPTRRISLQFSLGAGFTIVAAFLVALLFNDLYYQLSGLTKLDYLLFSVVIPFVGFFIIFSIEIGSRFFIQMRKSLIDVEKYKAESLQAQLHNLKNQINPHFLFNNLSVLSSLVYTNQDKAVDFIQQLSKVYRYLLDNRSFALVSLDKELDFINSYTFLLKIRFDEKLTINFNIAPESLNLVLPPMTLQILIENAIKHNEISSEKKLTINITANQNQLEISNNLQARTNTEPSSKTGLQNIRDRYAYFTNREIQIEQDKNNFTVKIPLIE
jgi:two-component system, LytTR family, sensor kinase